MKVQNGWHFPDADEFMVGHLGKDGSYQKTHLEAALSHITNWTCAIDGGAHVGTWSMPLAEKFARVIAFEPSTDTFEALTANLAQFGCINVEAHRLALGNRPARAASLHLEPRARDLKNTGARFIREDKQGDVDIITIDSLELSTLGFLKLDVEGSEVAALEGAKATIDRCKPIVLYEDKNFWHRYNKGRHAPQHFLEARGYRLLERVSMDVIYGPRS